MSLLGYNVVNEGLTTILTKYSCDFLILVRSKKGILKVHEEKLKERYCIEGKEEVQGTRAGVRDKLTLYAMRGSLISLYAA
jgi:hypothetical protein